mmetsp:Transcript_23922/g.49534  ORF Transcript_23922/g.49534 Transcript_23922/m.49534 type:complete len:200 (-) Transcript_23922:747-1346(-)
MSVPIPLLELLLQMVRMVNWYFIGRRICSRLLPGAERLRRWRGMAPLFWREVGRQLQLRGRVLGKAGLFVLVEFWWNEKTTPPPSQPPPGTPPGNSPPSSPPTSAGSAPSPSTPPTPSSPPEEATASSKYSTSPKPAWLPTMPSKLPSPDTSAPSADWPSARGIPTSSRRRRIKWSSVGIWRPIRSFDIITDICRGCLR